MQVWQGRGPLGRRAPRSPARVWSRRGFTRQETGPTPEKTGTERGQMRF